MKPFSCVQHMRKSRSEIQTLLQRYFILSSFKRCFSKYPNWRLLTKIAFGFGKCCQAGARPGSAWRERGASALGERMPGAPARLPGSPLCSQEDVSVKSRVGQVDCPGEGHACRRPEPSLLDTGIMARNAYNYGKWFPFSAKRGGREGEKAARSKAGASTQALGLV